MKLEVVGKGGGRTLASYGVVFSLYVFATWFTTPHTIGDTMVYVDAILRVINGGSTTFRDQGGFLSFWEFGHLLWRPLGWLFFRLADPLIRFTFGTDVRASVTLALIGLNWLFGVLAVFSLHALLSHLCRRERIILVATSGFIFSNAFLNFFQSGCSYVPGLALLLLGMYLIVKAGSEQSQSNWGWLLAGISLATSIGMWLPYVFAIPAALSSPVLLFGFTRHRLRIVLLTALSCGLTILLTYAIAIFALQLDGPSEIKSWIASSSHHVTENWGISRVLFGVPRSLIDMGSDSVFFKRFLTRDNYNPVTLLDLVRRSLWKLAFAYVFLISLSFVLLRSTHGRRVLALLLVNAVPVAGFALAFAGGVLERYLPLFPSIFIALGYSLSTNQPRPSVRYIALAFVLLATIVNVSATYNPVVGRKKEATTARLHDLQPFLNEGSRVFVAPQDQLWGHFGRLQLEQDISLQTVRIDPVAVLGTAQVPWWREEFAKETLAVWESKSNIWISKRLISRSPRSEWNWTEGEDMRIAWEDLYEFFSGLEVSTSVGGDDGFVLVTPSPKNISILFNVLHGTQPTNSMDFNINSQRFVRLA